ncbi:MAG: hypothetical protein KF708_08845 [Pirellulales bacterium]|nr:hypothetical protein [Pirellulales bacterium]
MNQDFILGRLAEIMAWETDQARREFAWLRLMSQMKYDGYQDFLAGARFVESLADWLQQFHQDERAIAYTFVRSSLVYISTAEMNHLVELFYPETVVWHLQQDVARRLDIRTWNVWASNQSRTLFNRLRRQSLFIELSDGARIDVFRRANAGLISNEQTVTAPRLNDEKLDELLEDLRKDLDDPKARFAFVFLIDDFVGSGTTLLRKKEDGMWTGKLFRFWEDNEDRFKKYFEDDWSLCVHHYLATQRAKQTTAERSHQIASERGNGKWFSAVQFSYGAELPDDLPLSKDTHADFLALTDRYYDPSIENKHTKVAGTDAKLGFGQCALPLVLEHNTPNNSVALLWADTPGDNNQHAMRPLFRRRQRHS